MTRARASDTSWDVIVIGAGHNGLTAAALLAKHGRRVLVVEKRDVVGGLAASESFAGNYRTAGILHDTTSVRHRLIGELGLSKHGLKLCSDPPSVYAPQANGQGLLLHHDPEKARGEISAFSERDADRYAQYRAFINRVRGVVNAVFDDIPPDVTRLSPRDLWTLVKRNASLRRLHRRDVIELFRIAPMSVADWLSEWFETDLLKAVLAGPAFHGAFMGPRSPGSAFNLLLWECRKGPSVKGGPGGLVDALQAAARANGCDIRTGAPATRIDVGNGRVHGVTLEDGEKLSAAVVAAACDCRQTLLQLLRGIDTTETLARHARAIRCRGTAAKVHIALTARLAIAGRPDSDAEFVRTGENLDDIEHAFDTVKYGLFPESLVLDIFNPSISSPDYAPDGHTVLSVLAHYVPYDLRDRWDYRKRELLGEQVLRKLSRYSGDMSSAVKAVDVVTPLDFEARYGTTEGHVYHGEHALDQLLARPTPECARYATPIGGLFLCGSGSFPGGGITCAPGALGARTILAQT
jgi:phytoene dehydrogenase-like protein